MAHQNPVFVDQWHKVGNCSQRNQIKVFPQIRLRLGCKNPLIAKPLAQRNGKIESDTDPCQCFEGEPTVRAERIDNGACFGEDV